MGFGGISLGSLLLIFMICVLLFGTKRLRSLGEDLGRALSGFKHGLKEGTEVEHQANNPEIKSSMNAYPASNVVADAATHSESDTNAKAHRV